jgi:hypothetical protein
MVLIAAGSLLVYAYTRAQATSAATSSAEASAGGLSALPADRFMQSIVVDDGALGWRQLCPEIQAALSQDEMTQQANAARAAAVQQGIHLTARFVSAHPRQGGGEQRLYLVTAHWTSGATQQRVFAIQTQASGCVDDVGYQ